MGKINSRAKGATGEREWARFLTEHGFPATRGRQFAGSSDSPDVRCAFLQGIHHEVKRVQALNINAAMSQSTRDAGDNIPLVAHRRNGERWKVTLWADDFLLYFAAAFAATGMSSAEKRRVVREVMSVAQQQSGLSERAKEGA